MRLRLLFIVYIFSLELLSAQSKKEPFAFGDFTWLNGVNRQKNFLLKNETIQGMIYFDTYYNFSFNQPDDHVLVGSTGVARHNEIVPNHLSFGLSTNYKNIIARFYYHTGQILTQVNDADSSKSRGWNESISNLRNIREAAAGYHFDKWNGLNIEMGILTSPIGQESFLSQENWNYQHAFVADFTPYYFTGIRCQIYPTEKLEIDYQLVNGWQTYAKYHEGFGQVLSINYRPTQNWVFDADIYWGHDNKEINLRRFHHDHTIQFQYINKENKKGISKAAISINNHYGNQTIRPGFISIPETPNYMFIGTNVANRIWFNKNTWAATIRGGYISNPGRYLVMPPLPSGEFYPKTTWDHADFKAWETAICVDWMPNENITFRAEWCSRFSNTPYYAGVNGTTSSDGWQGTPGSFIPDLRKQQHNILFAINFRL